MDFASKYAYVNAAEDDDEDAVVEEDELEESSLATNIMLSKGQSNNNNNNNDNDILDQLALQNDGLQADIAPQAPPAPSSSSSRVGGFLSGLFSRASAPPAPPVPKKEKDKKKDESKQQQSKRRFHRQADTNVVSLKFGSLADNADDLFAGDACHCANQNCRAVLSSTSAIAKRKKKASGVDQKDDDDSKAENFTSVKVVQEDAPKNAPAPEAMRIEIEEVDADEEEMVWKCEFCGNENVVDLAPEEIPKTESRDYVIEPAPEDEKVDDDGAELVIFVIDISGSMGVTTEVPGVFKLRGKPITRDTGFDIPAEDGFVNAPVQRSRNTTWVSRLQCVQAAVDQQIETWKKNNPTKKVAIVTFNREVTILGDGSSDPEIVAGDKLQNQEQLQEIGKKHGVIKPLAETGSKLSDKLFVLEETGPTALGPALLVAVSMASVAKGSRVIVCTDGLANVGLGALDKTSCPTEQLRQQAEQWYEGVGQMAKLSGASVSVISIKGDECSLEDLGRVAEITGGDVTRVDPLELQKNFATMLEKPIVATQVSATFLLHKGLKFRNENEETNRVTREVGNVTDDTEIIFEYSLRSKDALQAYPNLKALPFQVQIHFTKRNGMRCMRVLSKEQPITADKQQAAESARMDLLAANVAQLSAKLAEVGDYEEARVANVSYGRFMAKNARNDEQRHAVTSWLNESEEYHGALHRQQAKMKAPSSDRAGGSASPMLSMAPMALGAPSAAPSSRSAAKSVRSDEDFEMNHRFKSKSSKAYSRK